MARAPNMNAGKHVLSQLVTVSQRGRLLESCGVIQNPGDQGFVSQRVTFFHGLFWWALFPCASRAEIPDFQK